MVKMSKNNLIKDLDDTDRTILRLLQENGTMSNPKLAELLSLSVTPCWRRLKRLENEGFIKGYQANLDRRKLGYGVFAFVSLSFGSVGSEMPNRFEETIQECRNVLSCHKITGNSDYLLQVVAEDLDRYGDFIEMLRQVPGIHSIHSNLALKEIKATTRIPIPE
jgi:DNA-binding Lrp family transcriptional regulator